MRLTLCTAAFLAATVTHASVPIDGWYTSVFGGYSYVPGHINVYTIYGNYLQNVSFEGGYNAGGRVGFQSNPMRYELEYTYIHANTRDDHRIHFSTRDRDRGYTSGNIAMANVYYDVPEFIPTIAPFLGFGIGYAYLQDQIELRHYYGPHHAPQYSYNYDPTFLRISQSSFAFQGTAGVTYNFSENYALNLAYRYVATTSSDDFGLRYQAHLANAGVVYHFDDGSYK